MKIVSGGQTGVDRAALDVALKHGIECGGWCPAARLDEFGRIPDQYPVQELQAGGFTERTLQNVKDSDGTVVVYTGKLGGGTEQTVRFCVELRRPHQLITRQNFLPMRLRSWFVISCARIGSASSTSPGRARLNGQKATTMHFERSNLFCIRLRTRG